MIIPINILLKSALITVALFFILPLSFAQNDILELLPGSEKLEYDKVSGTHRLIGNVNFRYQGNTMYCDSAYYFERNKTVRAYGNVQIRKDDLNMFCDSLFYDGHKRKAKLWGHVRVRDSEYKLTTDTLNYDSKSGQAYFLNGGKVENILNKETLTSKIGYIHPDTKNFFFSRKVVYKGEKLSMTTDTLKYVYNQKKAFFFGPTNITSDSTNMYCESGWYNTENEEGVLRGNAWIRKQATYISGDTLLYQPLLKSYTGKGNVYYVDTTQKLSFKGDYAYSSDSLKYSFLTGHALAIKELEDDTLYIHADSLYSYKLDATDLMKAFNRAKFYSNSFQGMADSIVFRSEPGIMQLFKEPIIWSKTAELKGDSIWINLNDSLVENIHIRNNATILMEVEKELYYNQIAGNTVRADFRNNDLYFAVANGNARTVFFPIDEEKSDTLLTKKRLGMNRLYSSDLKIKIDSSQISSITYLDEPDGAFYPIDQIKKEEQFIEGFSWKTALRPKSMNELIEE